MRPTKLDLEQLEEALVQLEASTDPAHLVPKAAVLAELGRHEEAAQVYLKLSEVATQPAAAFSNVGMAYHKAGRLDKALFFFEKAAATAGDDYKILCNLATTYGHLEQDDKALELFDRVLKINPEYVTARYNRSDLLLSLGKMDEGWREYSWRMEAKNAANNYGVYGFDRWTGQDIADKHILVWTEQGIGEEVLMASMYKDLMTVAREATLLVSNRAYPFIKRNFESKNFHVANREIGLSNDTIRSYIPAAKSKVDYQMSFGDLGLVFRNSLEDFPEPVPYLSALKVGTSKLRARYRKEYGYKPLIGVATESNNADIGDFKSVRLGYLYPILNRSDATFMSLQHGFKREVYDDFNTACGTALRYDVSLGASYPNIEQLLCQIAAMDLVITSSNSVAHLAGAMGKETFILLPRGHGRLWFWFRDQFGNRTPWYKNVTTFTQKVNGDWDTAIPDVVEAVGAWLGQNQNTRRTSKQT